MVVVDEVSGHAMEVVDKRKTKGAGAVVTTILDPLEVGGVKAVPETGKKRQKWNVGTMAGRATHRASAGRSALIQTNPDWAKPNMEIGKVHSTLKGQKDPEPERVQPL